MIAENTPTPAVTSREKLDAISSKVIGAAYRVNSELGWGFLEKVYENSLLVELQELHMQVEQQPSVDVCYKGRVVGVYVPDLLVANELLVEVKAVASLMPQHRQQCLNYLRATGHRVCLLLNFGRPRLELKRFVWQF